MATVDVAAFDVDISLTGTTTVDVAELRVEVSSASSPSATVDVAEFGVVVTSGGAFVQSVDVADFQVIIGPSTIPPGSVATVDVAEFSVSVTPGGNPAPKTGAYVLTPDGTKRPVNPWTWVS